ncbi:hypothetical protein [Lacticaseibacillus suilingensis]|uniref:hypothetical protein n=1 Tax=Lacticaseibacillus suilingensis TaxID=2799577 RepID=UPI0022E8F204|nr:hypothetical protein [Lacticaseibacillus suilingensis]
MEELSKRKLIAMDEKFEEYQQVSHLLSAREYELRHPWTPTDANVGGGKSTMTADGEQRTLEAISQDPRMIYLTRLKNAGDAVVGRMTKDQKQVYEARYCSMVNYRWSELEGFLPFSHTAIYRYRYGILSALAKELGEFA